MSRILYNIAILFYSFLIRIASFFSPKAKSFVHGRRSLFTELKKAFKDNSAPVSWFHCASLGEFEQARPLIESFRREFPEYKILLTFFSPSGYEIRKNYSEADWVFYLPIDSKSNSRKFIEITNPKVAFIIKYEFWFNLLQQAQEKNISVLSVSSIFREDQHFFKPYGKLMCKALSFFDYFFVQDEHSLQLLHSIGLKNVDKSGDTRFDRVRNVSNQIKDLPIPNSFAKNHRVFVIGSCWLQDMEVLMPFINENKDLRFIIAPHTMEEKFIKKLEIDIQRNVVRYSKTTAEDVANHDVLIIDNIGMLSSLYQYGKYAYVGGAFGQGLHNILEPATFGLPVFFGNKNYKKFREARDLINLGGAFAVESYSDFRTHFNKLQDPDTYNMSSDINADYVKSNTGATDVVISYCKNVLKL